MARTIILGMNNPLSQRPEHALYPYPPGCTGHRILELIRRALPGATRKQYLAAFERRNLVIDGVDLDISYGQPSCQSSLPYPAKRCGYYVVTCEACETSAVVSTAGRPDDPRSVRMACKRDAVVH